MKRGLKWLGIGCGGLIGALILFGALLAIFVRHSSGTPTVQSSSDANAAAASNVGTMAKAESEARRYIVAHGGDAYRVQATIIDVVDFVQAVQKAPASDIQADLDRLATLAQRSHDYLDAIRVNFATAEDSGALGNAELEMFSGANDLKNSMGALVAEAGNPNAATVAQFNAQFARAVSEWNSGARTIWRIAHRQHPPLV